MNMTEQEAIENLVAMSTRLNLVPGHPWWKAIQMSITALKANEKKKFIKFLPCTCGANRRNRWYSEEGITLKCANCGKIAKGSSEREARINWNKMIEEEQKNG